MEWLQPPILEEHQEPAESPNYNMSTTGNRGLLVSYEPPEGVDPCVDVVFFHGLRGGRETTWTARGTNICWPRDLLHHGLPLARIMTYGYDADVTGLLGMPSMNVAGDHAKNLAMALSRS